MVDGEQDQSRSSGGKDDLAARIAAAKAATERGAPHGDQQAESAGYAIGIEFIGAVLVSGFIGWAIDRYALPQFAPAALIIFLFLGFIAGTRRALKTSGEFDANPHTGHGE